MNRDKINKFIAEVLGWSKIKDYTFYDIGYGRQYNDDGSYQAPGGFKKNRKELKEIPHYCYDLTACFEMEEYLLTRSKKNIKKWQDILYVLTNGVPEHSDAIQRCNAFVRAIYGLEKWNELLSPSKVKREDISRFPIKDTIEEKLKEILKDK